MKNGMDSVGVVTFRGDKDHRNGGYWFKFAESLSKKRSDEAIIP